MCRAILSGCMKFELDHKKEPNRETLIGFIIRFFVLTRSKMVVEIQAWKSNFPFPCKYEDPLCIFLKSSVKRWALESHKIEFLKNQVWISWNIKFFE